jgi:hypothetical protein
MRLRRLALMLLVMAGCPSREVTRIDPAQQKQERKDIPVEVNRDIDILFVIDNSGSMGEEQASLASNFFNFINVLEGIEGGLPNVHIGVVSSNVGAGGQPISACTGDGDNGRLQNVPRMPGCEPPSGYFINYDNSTGTPTQNYVGSLQDTFACIARLGINGCGFEQHMESMKRALDGRNPENANFLRPNAHLAVIFIADEDDCSATSGAVFDPGQDSISDPLGPRTSFRCAEFGYLCNDQQIGRTPATLDEAGGALECAPQGEMDPGASNPAYLWHPQVYVDFLRSLKVDPNLIIVGGIVGNPDPVAIQLDDDGNPEIAPSCVTSAGEADPAIRFKYFMDKFPNRNTFTSICNTDLSDALTQIAELLARVIGNPCLEGNISTVDVRDDMPGTQYDCQVSDVQYPNTDLESQTPIPRCIQTSDTAIDPSSPTPCWWMYQDTANCSDSPTGLTLIVERGDPPADPLPGTHVIASCVTD